MALLAINIDPIARWKKEPHVREPDPIQAALLAELAGADAIAMTLGDEREGLSLRTVIRVKYCLRVPPSLAKVRMAAQIKPEEVILLSDERSQDGETTLESVREEMAEFIQILRASGAEIALSIAPQIEQVKMAYRLETDAVFIRTNRYASAKNRQEADAEMEALLDACSMAWKSHLRIHVGGLLRPTTLLPLLREEPKIFQVHVGHSVFSRSVLLGLERSVSDLARMVH